MKKLSVLAALAVLLLAGCSIPEVETVKFPGADHYQVTFLGDIHYDGPQYHIKPLPEKAQRLHFTQWQKGISQQVLAAAAEQSKKDTAFVVQLGDMIQGDCDNADLQGAAYQDIFAMLKKYFAGKMLLAVRGNHGHLGANDAKQAPEKYLVPLIKKELGRDIKMEGTNYSVRYGKDLYIFYDYRPENSGKLAIDALNSNADARHVFFLTHLPMFPCSIGNPGWVVPQFKELIPLLARRKAIVINAHTHSMSDIVYKCDAGILPQITVTSMGREWLKKPKSEIRYKSFDEWKKNIRPEFRKNPKYKWSIENLQHFKSEDFIRYRVGHLEPSGFVKIVINAEKVSAHIFTDNSGKPSKTIVLKDK